MQTMSDALANKLRADGYQITAPPDSTNGYTFEAKKGEDCVAVQVREHKAKVNIANVQKFQEYLGLDVAQRFKSGWLVSASGFFNTVLTHAKTEEPSNLRLGTFSDEALRWDYAPGMEVQTSPPPPPEAPKAKLRYFGVFTCKGGVGKTTVAAHLAGAFALQGFDVILLDLDPEKNLRKLFLQDPQDEDGDASMFVRGKASQPSTTITVLNADEWDESRNRDIKVVICDCSPTLEKNPRDLIAKFDYCIIPTTLNPLGVAKNADVITRTFRHIRETNRKAEMFALINAFDASKEAEKRNGLLLALLKSQLDKYTRNDPKCKFIHPDDAKIRTSALLFNWGMHIVQPATPELAFKEVAGRCHPRVDFLQLAEYLENHTDIDSLKQQEK
jgi:chromosome partitioning protein